MSWHMSACDLIQAPPAVHVIQLTRSTAFRDKIVDGHTQLSETFRCETPIFEPLGFHDFYRQVACDCVRYCTKNCEPVLDGFRCGVW